MRYLTLPMLPGPTTLILSLPLQQLASVKTGRLNQKDQQHDGKGGHLRQRGVDEGSDGEDLPDDQGGDQGPLDAAQAADDNDHEDEGHDLEPHMGVHHDQGGMEPACQTGKGSGDDEGDREEPVDVDAEPFDVLDALDARPDRLAGNRLVQKEPDQSVDERGDEDDDQSVDGDFGAQDGPLGHNRHQNRAGDESPDRLDDTDAADQDSEGGDHRKGDIPLIDPQEDEPLHGKRADGRHHHPPQGAQPHTAAVDADRIGDISADGIVEELVETDDAHQAETERQTDRHQKIDATDAQTEDHAGSQQLCVHIALVTPNRSFLF